MRAEVRIIQDQQVEIKPADISQTEREMLLAKYGHQTNQQQSYIDEKPSDQYTFEEMCRMEEEKLARERYTRQMQQTGPKPISFGGNYESDVKYGSDSDSGLTFKISVVSDMPIPKY